MRRIVGFALLALVLSCASVVVLSPEGEQLRVVRDKSDVGGCKMLGVVEAKPAYIGPKDAEYTLRNKAAALGAVTLLAGSMSQRGVAYRCH